MLETVMKHNVIFYVMGSLMTVGILAKLVSYFTARKLVKAAGDIQKSNQKLMRLVKAKFEHASMVSDKVKNVEAFVNKYFYEYKVLGARLGSWRSCPIKMIGLIITFGIVGMAADFKISGFNEQTFRYGALAAIYAVVLASIHILSDEKTKLDAAKNYMVEYLENVCVRRYEKANQAMQAAEKDIQPAEVVSATENAMGQPVEEVVQPIEDVVQPTEEVVRPVAEVVQAAEEVLQTAESEIVSLEPEPQTSKEEPIKIREDQEMRIRAILEEFFA